MQAVDLLAVVTDRLRALATERARVLVAVDGPDAAGKTTLADAVAAALPDLAVVRAGVDDHLRPAGQRYARGPLSPEGCYRDSHDLPALTAGLLDPFAAGAPQVTVRPGVVVGVPERAVLVVDGVFLLRPELRDRWTWSVHLHVPPGVVLARAAVRDAAALGGPDAVRARYLARYLPAQDLYRADADPLAVADLVVDVRDPARPVVVERRPDR